jgi:hypothetical protein
MMLAHSFEGEVLFFYRHAFPEFRENQHTILFPDEHFRDKYRAGNNFSHYHPVFFVSHQWRTPRYPDPDGTDCALLRKMTALTVGLAASNVLAQQRRRRQAQEQPHRRADPQWAQRATQQLIQDYQNGIFYRPNDDSDHADIESPLDAYIQAICARSSASMVLQMALGRNNRDNINNNTADLAVLEGVTKDLLGPIALQALLAEGPKPIDYYLETLVTAVDTSVLERAIASSAAVNGIYVWLDYSSLPQHPRSEIEQEYFGRALQNLSYWQRRMCTLVLYHTAEDWESYHRRLWCVVEDVCGSKNKIDPRSVLRPGFTGPQDLGVFAVLEYLNEIAQAVPLEDRSILVTNGADILPIMRILGDYSDCFDSTVLGNIVFSSRAMPMLESDDIMSILSFWSLSWKEDHQLTVKKNQVQSSMPLLISSNFGNVLLSSATVWPKWDHPSTTKMI